MQEYFSQYHKNSTQRTELSSLKRICCMLTGACWCN